MQNSGISEWWALASLCLRAGLSPFSQSLDVMACPTQEGTPLVKCFLFASIGNTSRSSFYHALHAFFPWSAVPISAHAIPVLLIVLSLYRRSSRLESNFSLSAGLFFLFL